MQVPTTVTVLKDRPEGLVKLKGGKSWRPKPSPSLPAESTSSERRKNTSGTKWNSQFNPFGAKWNSQFNFLGTRSRPKSKPLRRQMSGPNPIAIQPSSALRGGRY